MAHSVVKLEFIIDNFLDVLFQIFVNRLHRLSVDLVEQVISQVVVYLPNILIASIVMSLQELFVFLFVQDYVVDSFFVYLNFILPFNFINIILSSLHFDHTVLDLFIILMMV